MSEFLLDGIVFDVDGVLFDTERLGLGIWTEVSSEFGCPQLADHYLECVGRIWSEEIMHLKGLLGSDFPLEAFFHACSQRTQTIIETEGVPLKPGVSEILEFLQARHIPAALATSTYLEHTSRRLELAALRSYFREIVTGDQITQGKPNPEIYQTACRRLGIAPSRAIAVEDSRNGILAAVGAGMRTVMIPDLIAPTPEVEPLLFKRFVSLLELRDFLAEALS